MTKVSIVIPCYNEAEGISQLREKLLPVLERVGRRYQAELILVDDGSTDQTNALLHQAFDGVENARVVKHEKNLNLGGAVRTGIRESSGEWIANLDSDCTYDPALLEPMLDAMEAGADLVTVSPYHPRGRVEGVPAYRLFLSTSLTAMYRAILRKKIYTFTALNRVYKRSICATISSPAFDFTCLAEMMLKALKQGKQVSEVPAVLSVRRFGESKMKTGRVIQAHLRLLSRLLFDPGSFSK
ncbi:MAG: glycosyltransferase family 2 protein [Candidatus Eremiobacteraeota bacterium]|nr:glycosyltransferase family 2 protein [Candidatus Eremiobacteraeota bacterium]